MQMNRIEHDLWVRAVNELCRACAAAAALLAVLGVIF